MSGAADILTYLTASPGKNAKEVHAVIGGKRSFNSVSAQLSTMAKAGKLRRDSTAVRGGRYWITDQAHKDMRLKENRATAPKAHKPKPAITKAAPRGETRAAMRARIAAECAGTIAKPAEVPRFITPRRLTVAVTGAQTVDEFLRAGGVIQKLHPHATSTPLRFDHDYASQPRSGRIQRRHGGAL